jgi:Papain family cysteine protease/Domain of unknown function (DUF4384)
MSVFTVVVLLLSHTFSLAQTKPAPRLKQPSPRLHVIFALEPRGVEFGRVNMENDTLMRQFVETVQRGLGYPMKIRWMDPKYFTSKALKDTISALKTTPNDIVILYYSGYGIPPAQPAEKFANWRLNDVPTRGLPVNEVENWLKAKKIHLGLLIADCATVKIDNNGAAALTYSTVDLTASIMKKLFLHNKGIVRLGSSAPLLPSYNNTTRVGTLFTYGLSNGFSYLLNSTDPARLPDISFEDLRFLTEASMGEAVAGSDYTQVPVLELKNWDGTPVTPKPASAGVAPINVRWQGLVVDDRAYEQLTQKKISKLMKKLPPRIDLSPYAPPVINQGDKGNCVAISVGYYMRSIMEAVKWNLTKKDDILKRSFSPFYLYSSLKKENDRNCTFGIDAAQAFQFLKEIGLPRFSDFPDPDFCDYNPKASIEYTNRIKDYVKLFSITDPKASKILAVKQTLADMSPVVVGIQTTNSLQNLAFVKTMGSRLEASVWELKAFFTNSVADKDRSRLNLAYDPYRANALAFGHAMCVVGYDDTMLGKGAFKLINSWGSSWGNDGYFWMSYDEFGKFAKYGYQAYLDESGSAIRLDNDLSILVGASRSRPAFTLMPSDTGLVTYALDKPMRTGTKFKFDVEARKKTYLYLITGSSSDSTVILEFPKRGERTVVVPNKRMYYPGEHLSLTLGGKVGTEYWLFLFSDSEIGSIDELVDGMNDEKGPFSDRVQKTFGRRLIPNRQILYKPKKMGFFLSKNSQSQSRGKVVPLLVRMNHVR